MPTGVPRCRGSQASAGQGRWRPRLRLVLVVLTVLCMAALTPHAAAADRERSAGTRPGALWRAFPLRVEPSRTAQPRRVPPPTPRQPDPVVAIPAPPVSVLAPREDGSGSGPYAILGIVVVATAAAGGAFLLLRGPARRWSNAVTAMSTLPAPRLVSTFVQSHGRSAVQPYVLVVPGRGGFGDRMVERVGKPPARGEMIVDTDLGGIDQMFLVQRVGRSPIPGDKRPCAVLRKL